MGGNRFCICFVNFSRIVLEFYRILQDFNDFDESDSNESDAERPATNMFQSILRKYVAANCLKICSKHEACRIVSYVN